MPDLKFLSLCTWMFFVRFLFLFYFLSFIMPPKRKSSRTSNPTGETDDANTVVGSFLDELTSLKRRLTAVEKRRNDKTKDSKSKDSVDNAEQIMNEDNSESVEVLDKDTGD